MFITQQTSSSIEASKNKSEMCIGTTTHTDTDKHTGTAPLLAYDKAVRLSNGLCHFVQRHCLEVVGVDAHR